MRVGLATVSPTLGIDGGGRPTTDAVTRRRLQVHVPTT
jgi:hypothetical protein